MKRGIVKVLCILSAFFIILSSQGCAYGMLGEATEIDSLKVITPEQIESIFAEISLEETDKYPDETDEEGNGVVFWLEGGSVWHISQFCPSIEKADPEKVKHGSQQDALDSGKKRACKVCGDGTEVVTSDNAEVLQDGTSEPLADQVSDKYPKEYTEDGQLIVFWLENSNVWHISRSCSSLSRSDPAKIIHGVEADAIAAGKERPCKTCSK